jgi:hypothetical protein
MMPRGMKMNEDDEERAIDRIRRADEIRAHGDAQDFR